MVADAPAETVDGGLARVVGRPAVGIARRGAGAHEDDLPAELARAEGGERRADGGEEAEEVDVEVLLPLLDGNVVRGDLAHGFEHSSV